MTKLKKFRFRTALAKALRAASAVAIGIQGTAQLLPDQTMIQSLPPAVLFGAIFGGIELARNYWKHTKVTVTF